MNPLLGQDAARERLIAALAAVTEAQEPPGGLFAAVRQELKDATANKDWRENRRKTQKQLAEVVTACLASGLTESELNTHLKSVGAEIVPNGPRRMLKFMGGDGWFVDGKD